MTHLGRSTPSKFTEEPFHWLDIEILNLVAHLAQQNITGDYWNTLDGSLVADRIHLRISDGGLGIPHLKLTAHKMYVGSLALTLNTILKSGFLIASNTSISASNIRDYSEAALPHLPPALQSINDNDLSSYTLFTELCALRM
jgi:hypothetical protein